MAYSIKTFDVCFYGNERLRNRSEIILHTYISSTTLVDELQDELLQEIDACERPDDFDFDGARAVVVQYFDDVLRPLWAKRSNPFHVEDRQCGDDDTHCSAFLFLDLGESESD